MDGTSLLSLLGHAVWVMIFGMAIVFCFLVILIGATKLSAVIIKAMGLDHPEPAKSCPAIKKKEVPTAAIAAAVNTYRKQK